MAKRQVFLSFDYDEDVIRASQIKEMGALEKETLFSGNGWEKVKYQNDNSIKKWIEENMKYRSCVIVLIGEKTSNSEWVLYEIKKAVENNKPIFGIYIHNLKDMSNKISSKGLNPFDKLTLNGEKLSNYVDCYNPKSFDTYNDIKNNIEKWIETAVNS